MSRLTKLAILDRDGVLVRAFPHGNTTRGPRTLEELEFLPGVKHACQLLRDAGYILAVATNQPDITRGFLTSLHSLALQSEIVETLGVSHYATCPHDDTQNCSCRKPEPGLLYQLAVEADANLRRAIMFGDRETDMVAARQAGVGDFCGIETNGSLLEAVKTMLQGESK